MPSVLTAEGRADFARLEKTIKAGLETFVEVGTALAEIKERMLFKEVCPSFEGYVQIRWGFSYRHAVRYIAAAETVKLITAGSQPDQLVTLPTSESVARPLTELPKEQVAEAWEDAKKAAKAEGKTAPTATHTTAAVESRRKEKRAERKVPEADATQVGASTQVPGAAGPLAASNDSGHHEGAPDASRGSDPRVKKASPTNSDVGGASALPSELPTVAEMGALPEDVQQPGSSAVQSEGITPAVVGGVGASALIAERVAALDALPSFTADEYRAAAASLHPSRIETARAWHRFLGHVLVQADLAAERAKRGVAA